MAERTPLDPVYSGEGFRRKLIGWFRASDRTLYTVNHQISQETRMPKEFAPGIPVNKQIHHNKAHHKRLHALVDEGLVEGPTE